MAPAEGLGVVQLEELLSSKSKFVAFLTRCFTLFG